MKHIKTYSEFVYIKESAATGKDSRIVIDDTYISSIDKEIKGAEILGVIQSSETETEFLDYFYNEYGNGSFTKKETSILLTFYNGYMEELEDEKTNDIDDKDTAGDPLDDIDI